MLWMNHVEHEMKVIRLAKVVDITGLARSTIYKYIAAGEFPRPIALGARRVGWIDKEIDDWIINRISLRDCGEVE